VPVSRIGSLQLNLDKRLDGDKPARKQNWGVLTPSSLVRDSSFTFSMSSHSDPSSEKDHAREETASDPPARRRTRTPRFTGRVLRSKLASRHGWLGDYNYSWLCTPSLPFLHGSGTRRRAPPFYGLDDDLPLLLAIVAGFQHALAMLAGLITPPIIFASALNVDGALQVGSVSRPDSVS
jgi:hypothetical protein